MARIRWRDYQASLAPQWLRKDGVDEAWFEGLGDEKQQLEDLMRESLRAKLPGVCAPDSLAAVGGDRGFVQGPTETVDQFRARVLAAWDLWYYAGTAYGVLTVLRLAGYPNVAIIIQQGYIYTLDISGNLVITYSGGPFSLGYPNFWNRFRVIFYAPLPASWLPAPANIPANNSDEANNIRNIIRTWKPAHADLKDIVIWYAGLIWGFPTGGAPAYWGAGTWGGGFWGVTSAGNTWGGAGLVYGGSTVVWTP